MSFRTFILGLGLVVFWPTMVSAQLSPGPLADPHAHLSGMTNCLKCHAWGSKDLTPKCLGCHTLISERIDTEQGYHGGLKETTCQSCHKDHKQRDFNMIHWEPSQSEFDHELTGYNLEGKHIDLKCEDCHQSKLIQSESVIAYAQSNPKMNILDKTFLGMGTNCSDCHEDVHKQEFENQKCQECHNQQNWQEVTKSFDHDKKTDFPLRGAHKKIDCEKCHKESLEPVGKFQVQRFSGLKFDQCTNCHEDEHKGSFGNNCLKCHTENTFKIKNIGGAFNHNTTRYPLIGKHTEVKCNKCHTSEDRFEQTSSYDACFDCHPDYHKDIFRYSDRNTSCDQCHSVRGFFPALFGVKEHDNTKFPLEGAHLAQPCVFCHLKEAVPTYQWDPVSCQSCHLTPHGTQFEKYKVDAKWCESCHISSSWEEVSFDHQATQFPLLGKHNETNCNSCHKAQDDIVQYESINTECASCHQDVHAQQFVNRTCGDCHAASGWKINGFDHFKLTEFPLDGQHKDLSCGGCHKFESPLNTIRFKPIPHKCQDCHSFGDFKR
mgnify:CR=1 FL=1